MERFTIESDTVGQGGFGKVRRGQDNELDRKVAIKSLDPLWRTAEPADKERFRREARTLAKLSHPNIPAIYDVQFSNDHMAIVFQYVEGTTLRDLLENESTLPLSDCRSWFDQVASALQHAHDNGIVHRDVKPENLIISADRKHCYIVDFGIAFSKSEAERLTGSDEWIGTPGYMSPEQENGEEPDPRDDLHALGITLYEALCGHRVQPGDYQPLNVQSELIPPDVDNLVRRCIAEKPVRLKAAEEFRSQLKSALSGHRSLAEVLRVGQLHEIVASVSEMSAAQFMQLTMGQRLLILQKCKDVLADTDQRLGAARLEFLIIMPRLGIHLDSADYRPIIEAAIRYGFGSPGEDGKTYTRGYDHIRTAFTEAAVEVTGENLHVIVESTLHWVDEVDLPI